MSKDEVSRRVVVGALGVGVASAAAGAAALGRAREPAQPESSAAVPISGGPAKPTSEVSQLFSPLVAGAALGRWTVEEILPLAEGAASVVLSDRRGERFQLDVCARDDASDARRGPGASERFEVFLANLGDGTTSTHEDHGLAAMALAELIRGNEQHVDHTAFQTLRQRVEAHRARRHVT
jgi:hypothetical protein